MTNFAKAWIRCAAAVAALATAGAAQATVVTWTQTFSPTNGYELLTRGEIYNYAHYLNQGTVAPSSPGSFANGSYSNTPTSYATFLSSVNNNLIGASLTLYFADDASDTSEWITYTIEGYGSGSEEVDGSPCKLNSWTYGTIFSSTCTTNFYDRVGPFSVSLGALSDGIVNVTLTASSTSGTDAYFKGSILKVRGETRVQVPEPATLGLLGLGLVGVGLARRRRLLAG